MAIWPAARVSSSSCVGRERVAARTRREVERAEHALRRGQRHRADTSACRARADTLRRSESVSSSASVKMRAWPVVNTEARRRPVQRAPRPAAADRRRASLAGMSHACLRSTPASASNSVSDATSALQQRRSAGATARNSARVSRCDDDGVGDLEQQAELVALARRARLPARESRRTCSAFSTRDRDQPADARHQLDLAGGVGVGLERPEGQRAQHLPRA